MSAILPPIPGRDVKISTTALFLLMFCHFQNSSIAQEVDYARDIKPLLQKRCTSCHGSIKQEANLRLDTGSFIRAGGDSGPSVIASNPVMSLIIERVTSPDDALRMPPEGKPLAHSEIDQLSRWINTGAHSPENEQSDPNPRDHWSFKSPTRPTLPFSSTTVANPIDLFISQKLSEQSIEPLPRADKRTLLRRVTMDLVGLPPTPQETRAFADDTRDDAYERVVDRLLASPQQGERWARHWMDVWRYSDWYGRRAVPDVMNSYPHIWRWRDWIVSSLNRDKGYDEMIVEMLAADEAHPGDDEAVVATGFLVRNWFKWNYENWMKDNVEHTAKSFLGITMNCCHCHDHKYDPVTQEEYFQFRAFFEPLELRQDRVANLPDPGPFRKYVYAESYGPIPAGLVRVFDEKPDAPTFMYVKGDSRNRMPDKPPVKPGVPEILGKRAFHVDPISLPPEAFYPGLKSFVRAEEIAKREAELAAAKESLIQAQATRAAAIKQAGESSSPPITQSANTLLEADLRLNADTQRVVTAEADLRALQARIAADDAKYKGIGDPVASSRAAALLEKQFAYELARLREIRAEKSLTLAQAKLASDPNAKADADKSQTELTASRASLDAARSALASPGESYTPLSPVYPATSTGRRLALARWIADKGNPLTARVGANHVWMRHFGRGLVETPSNFGLNGKVPSHPELLDWLAVEWMENDWQFKHLHRLLVTSDAYTRDSHPPTEQHPSLVKDRDNRLYGRMNPRRIEAEAVRDSILACAETLDVSMGGQEIDLAEGLTARRRSLYFASHGEARMPFLEIFDVPDVCDAYERVTSTRPQQALALTNSELPLNQSKLLAETLWTQLPESSEDGKPREVRFIEAAFERILSRTATNEERNAAVEYLTEQRAIAIPSGVVAATAGGVPVPPEIEARARASFIHALFSHHDFVTVR